MQPFSFPSNVFRPARARTHAQYTSQMNSPHHAVVAIGANLGDRARTLRDAVRHLTCSLNLVRLSSVWETAPIDCPLGSSPFLNMVAVGVTRRNPRDLLDELHEIELTLGRVRRLKNESRRIDLDLIFYGAFLVRRDGFELPHPRYHERSFVLDPFRELDLDWTISGLRVRSMVGDGAVRRVGSLYSVPTERPPARIGSRRPAVRAVIR